MPNLINLNDFPVWVHDLGQTLAPLETVVVKDAALVERLLASGVLSSDAKALETKAHELAKLVGSDTEDIKSFIEQLVATSHDEHGTTEPVDKPQVTPVSAAPVAEAAPVPKPVVEPPQPAEAEAPSQKPVDA